MQVNACFAFASALAAEPTVHDDARHADIMVCCIHALRAHAADEYVPFFACRLLHQLLIDQPVNTAEAWRLGAFPLLVQVSKFHKKRRDLMVQCLQALTILVAHARPAGFASMLSAADAVAAMCATIAVLHAHPVHFAVQNVACKLVNDLAHGAPEVAAAGAEAGAMEAMVDALNAFQLLTACSFPLLPARRFQI